MKIPGSHPSFVTGISRVLVFIPSSQLFHHALPAWPTPGLVLHAWGGAFERRCAGVAMMQSAYRRAYRQGRYPVTGPAPSAAPGWVRGQSGDQRVAAFWQTVTMSSQVRWPFIQIRGAAPPPCWRCSHPCSPVTKTKIVQRIFYASNSSNCWR